MERGKAPHLLPQVNTTLYIPSLRWYMHVVSGVCLPAVCVYKCTYMYVYTIHDNACVVDGSVAMAAELSTGLP